MCGWWLAKQSLYHYQFMSGAVIGFYKDPMGCRRKHNWLIANVRTKIIHDTTKRKVTEIVEGIRRTLSKG